jgi:hypothetical protein
MDELIIKKIADEPGLADGGKDEEGNQLWLGTDNQWKRFAELQEGYDIYAEEEENAIFE